MLAAVNSLVNDTSLQITSRSEISVREKEDRLWLNPDVWSLLSVSISWLDQAGKAKMRVFDMAVSKGMCPIDTKQYL